MARQPLTITLDEDLDIASPPLMPTDLDENEHPGDWDGVFNDEMDAGEPLDPDDEFAQEDLVDEEELEDDGFDDNLALSLTDDELKDLAREVIDHYTQDLEDRKPWHDRFTKGLDMLGLTRSDIDDGPFPGASSIVHPLLVEAQVQFWARAYAELFPASGPCKAVVLGERTQERYDSAMRVEDYLNYEMTTLDSGYASETSRLLLAVPFMGSAFRKTFRDFIRDVTTGVYVSGEDIIAPWDTVDLQTAPRFSHRMTKTRNDVRKLQRAGFYMDIELPDAEPDDLEDSDPKSAKAEVQDVEHNGEGLTRNTRVLYECYIELNLPGFEDADERGETGIELPYIVTVDHASEKILSIYRNWDRDDELKRREVVFTKFDYVPGQGFYGSGLIHLIGGLQEGATGALRCLLDSAATASLPGGFVAKDARLSDDRLEYEPGVFKQVEATAEDLQNAFFQPPTRDPSPVLYQLLEFLTNASHRFTSTTEMMVGETNRNQPVGTTLALLEQGQKVLTAIHRGLHAATAGELRLRKKMAFRYISDDGYPYDTGGQKKEVFESDFAEVDIVPVSDPNVVSTAQRVAMNQMAYQLAGENPDILDRQVAIRRLLDGVKMPDVDELFVAQQEPQAYDAAGEIQAVMMGKPVLVLPQQQHVAYLHVWTSFLQNQGYGANPQVMQAVGPAMQTVIGQHLAYAWLTGVREQGIPAPAIDPNTGQPQSMEAPPEQINEMLLQIAPALAQMPGLPAPPPGPDPAQEAQLKLQQADQAHQQQLMHKEQAHQQELKHIEDDHQVKQGASANEAMQKAQIREAEHAQDLQKKEIAHSLEVERKVQEQEIAQAERVAAQQEALTEKAMSHGQQLRQAEDQHEQKMQESIDAAILNQAEREEQYVQKLADQEIDNAQKELDAHRDQQAKDHEFENKKRLQSLAEMGAKKKSKKAD